MKRKWTRAEKLLWLAPLIFVVGAGAAAYAPTIVRRQLGRPVVLQLKAGDHVDSIALSHDGTMLAAMLLQRAPNDGPGQVYFWNARTLKPLAPMGTRPAPGKRNAFGFALAISPDGKLVALAPLVTRRNQPFTLYERVTKRAQWKLNGFFWHSSASFAPNGKTLVVSRSAKDGCQILLLRASDGQVLTQWHSRVSNSRMRITWAPDGKTLACSGALTVPATEENFRGISYQIETRRADDGKLLHNFAASPLQSLNFSPDGRHLLVVTYQDVIRGAGTINYEVAIFDAATGKQQWHFGNNAGGQPGNYSFGDAKFSPDGKTIAALSATTGQVLLLNPQTGKLKRALSLNGATNAFSSTPDALAWAPDGKRLYARGQNAVLVWNLD